MKRYNKYMFSAALSLGMALSCMPLTTMAATVHESHGNFYLSDGGKWCDANNSGSCVLAQGDTLSKGMTFKIDNKDCTAYVDGTEITSGTALTSYATITALDNTAGVIKLTSVEGKVSSYTITYDTNGGSTIAKVTNQTSIPATLPTPTKDGSTFAGWYTDDELKTQAVAGKAITANTTLYAKWTEDEPSPQGDVAVTGVSLDETSLELEEGDSETLIATVSPDDATDPSVTWESSDEDVATVTDDGRVDAISEGSAVITVTTTDGGYTATCDVTVSAESVDVTGVTLDQTSMNLTVEEFATLTATVSPEDATNKDVSWTSTDESVATVSDDGVVTAVGEGKAVITVITDDGSYSATCDVTVKSSTVAVTGVKLNKKTLALNVGKKATLTATVSPKSATNKAVTWSVGNKSVATVKDGVVTAKKAGSTVITVKTKDGSYKATCKVTVTDAAVTNVESKIDAIGTVEYTDACKAKIDAARKAYDALSKTQKAQVSNYSKLTDAEAKYNELKTASEYKIVEGTNSKWTSGSKSTLTFKGNGAFNKFKDVKVDGKVIDSKYYDAKEGSTVITLHTDYLGTLSAGTHSFEIEWTDGSAKTQFTVQKTNSNSNTNRKTSNNVKTGVMGSTVYLITGAASVGGIGILGFLRRKNRNKK